MMLDLVDYELKAHKAMQFFSTNSVVSEQGKRAVTAKTERLG